VVDGGTALAEGAIAVARRALVNRKERTMEDERLTINEVAVAYKIPLATLRYWRARGEGPRSFRLGRRVFYRKQDCEAWVDAAYARQSVGGVA